MILTYLLARLLLANRQVLPWKWPSVTRLGLALPLFLVTMASQNVAGVAVLRTAGHQHAPVSRLVAITGIATILLAPFRVFALNLAAITAAICMGTEAHPATEKRYYVAMWAGGFYMLVGVATVPVSQLFQQLPTPTNYCVGGFSTVANAGNQFSHRITYT